MAVTQSPSVQLDSDRPANRAGRPHRWAAIVLLLPELIALAVAGFSVPSMVLLLANQFRPAIAIPLGVLGAIGAVVASGLTNRGVESDVALNPKLPGQSPRAAVLFTIIAIAFALAWMLVSLRYYAEDVFAQRDPATYSLAARWLVSHHSLAISTDPQLFGRPPGFDDTSAGFAHMHSGTVYAQGNHLLPVLLACIGWAFGSTALLQGNIVIGALALVAFFGVARQIAGHAFALVAVIALSVSMPYLYVTRDTYSESLALLLTMGGLALLYRALRSGRVRDYGTAGFVTGATALVRIDGYVTLLCLLIIGAVVIGLARGTDPGAGWRRGAALFVPALVMTLLGWLDVTRLSPSYYQTQQPQISQILKGAVLLTVLSIGLALLLMRPAVRRLLVRLSRTQLTSFGLGLAVVAAFVVLVTRPQWMQTHGIENTVVSTTQRLAGMTIDGTRTYNEQTVSWQAMYLGWPTVLLAVAGYVLLAVHVVRHRELALLGILTVGPSMTVLYLWSSKITPDQVWAMRRYVPVVMPVLLIAAVYVLAVLWAALAGRWNGRSLDYRAIWGGRTALVLIAALLVAIPLSVSHPVLGLREEVPQIRQVNAICRALPSDAALLIADDGLRWGYSETMRAYCDVPTIAVPTTDATTLAQVRSSVAAGGHTLYVMASRPSELPYAQAAPNQSFSTVKTTRWPSVIGTAPKGPAIQEVSVYLGTVGTDGLVSAVSR
jgi:hypothetical protein